MFYARYTSPILLGIGNALPLLTLCLYSPILETLYMQHNPRHPRRSSMTSRIAGYVFLIITLSMLAFTALVQTQLQWSIQQQADAVGHSLLLQTRNVAENALSTDDTLSVAVLVRQLVDNPYVSYAALQNLEQRTIAEAGLRSKSSKAEATSYSQALSLQGQPSGSLLLQIDTQHLQSPLAFSMQSIAAMGLGIALLALLLAIYLGRSIAVPLQSLSDWLVNPSTPAPQRQRSDEIGLLARQLNQQILDETPQRLAPEDKTERTPLESSNSPSPLVSKSSAPQTAALPAPLAMQLMTHNTTLPFAAGPRTAILAVELGHMDELRKLSKTHLAALIAKHNAAVKHAARLYSGQLYTLTAGRMLMTFSAEEQNYPRNAICAAELLRAFASNLHNEIRNSGINLHIQLGLSEGHLAKDITLGELLLSETAQTALKMNQSSYNVLILSNSLAQNSRLTTCARMLAAPQPEDASSLVSLIEPYRTQVQSQLHSLQHNLS